MTKKKEESKEQKKDKEEKSLEQEGNDILNDLLSKERQDKFVGLLGTFAESIAQDVMIRKIKYKAALAAGFNEEQAFEYCMKGITKK